MFSNIKLQPQLFKFHYSQIEKFYDVATPNLLFMKNKIAIFPEQAMMQLLYHQAHIEHLEEHTKDLERLIQVKQSQQDNLSQMVDTFQRENETLKTTNEDNEEIIKELQADMVILKTQLIQACVKPISIEKKREFLQQWDLDSDSVGAIRDYFEGPTYQPSESSDHSTISDHNGSLEISQKISDEPSSPLVQIDYSGDTSSSSSENKFELKKKQKRATYFDSSSDSEEKKYESIKKKLISKQPKKIQKKRKLSDVSDI